MFNNEFAVPLFFNYRCIGIILSECRGDKEAIIYSELLGLIYGILSQEAEYVYIIVFDERYEFSVCEWNDYETKDIDIISGKCITKSKDKSQTGAHDTSLDARSLV